MGCIINLKKSIRMKLSIVLQNSQDSHFVESVVTDHRPKNDLQFFIDFLSLDLDQDPCSVGYAELHQGFMSSVMLFASIELLKNPDHFSEMFECSLLTREAILASAERFIIAYTQHINHTRSNPQELFNVGIRTCWPKESDHSVYDKIPQFIY